MQWMLQSDCQEIIEYDLVYRKVLTVFPVDTVELISSRSSEALPETHRAK